MNDVRNFGADTRPQAHPATARASALRAGTGRRDIPFLRLVAFSSLVAFATVHAQQSGDLDTTFNGGAFDLQVGTGASQANAVAVQNDGRVVVGGQTAVGSGGIGSAWALVRLNGNGTTDTTFGGGTGQVILPVGGPIASGTPLGRLNALVVQSDGKILGVGTGLDATGMHANVDVIRWNTSGTLDASFGTGGVVETDLGTNGSFGFAIGIGRNGKPVVVATQFDAPPAPGAITPGEPVVIRYTTSGALDTGFGTGGIFRLPASVPTASRGWGWSIAFQPDDKILVGSEAVQQNEPEMLRLTSTGQLDASFGSGGITILPVLPTESSSQYGVMSIAPLRDGRILCVAFQEAYAVLIQLNADGSLDTTYGTRPPARGWTPSDQPSRSLLKLPTGSSRVAAGLLPLQGRAPSQYLAIDGWNGLGSAGDRNFIQTGSDQPYGISRIVGPSGTATLSILAMALQPDGRFLVAGVDAGKFLVGRYVGNALVLQSRAFSFANVTGVPTSTLQTSNAMKVVGLSGGAYVPVYVSGGSYSLNGGPFTTTLGYATNFDLIVVQHTSAATSGTSVTTTLRVGALNTPTRPWLVDGLQTVSTFTSTTQ